MSGNLHTLELVAKRLGALRDDVVFVGGAVTELLVTDAGAPEPRVTADVDAIVEVATTTAGYYAFAGGLRAAGFAEDRSEGAPVCRWVVDGIRVDFMPPDEHVLGFANRWYAEAARAASVARLPGGTAVRVVTAPYFLATKLEAFDGRGRGDFRASRDIEDLVAVLDGRPELRDEVQTSPVELRKCLAVRIAALLDAGAFLDSIPGHLPPDEASQQRVTIVLERLRELGGLASGGG